ncbi:uncharacterized protein LOC129573086 [Sitodiplosis mosellana]|uniref:uncharacterized protein LOC129573086 n=1 Tax=Sitodiplosis mosellana TaxID=263140 RepID=UPI00244490A2|nr:uncharacterized protein LOC129573086 [Sitodiplosis mosellana]
MTEFIEGTLDSHLEHGTSNKGTNVENGENSSDSDDSSPNSDASITSSGSWSIDDSIGFMQTSHKPMFDELPTFSIKSASPNGQSISPMVNEPISLFNLSISPISSIEDLSRFSDQIVCAGDYATNEKITKNLTQVGDSMAYDDDDERISLEEITAQINTPPSALSRSNKRLNLETIFEDVFLETPKKRRFNGFKRFNSWRIEERINSYVFEQQKNHNEQDKCQDTTSTLCNVFDDKININI